jgi:hypothetical protein
MMEQDGKFDKSVTACLDAFAKYLDEDKTAPTIVIAASIHMLSLLVPTMRQLAPQSYLGELAEVLRQLADSYEHGAAPPWAAGRTNEEADT